MTEPQFHVPARRLTAAQIVDLTGATLLAPDVAERTVDNIAALEDAGPGDLAFFDNPAYARNLKATRAGLCLVKPRFLSEVPSATAALVSDQPYRGFVKVAQALFPDALRPGSLFGAEAVAPGAFVHPTARLEAGVRIDPAAVIGPAAEIGAGTVIAAGAAVGPGVRIGRDCSIGAGATLQCALIGNCVIVHPGCRIGQDGFGYVMGAAGHGKVPQVGRVIIQDDVEIGANSTVDRGATRDTVIGEGTKIDNLVQVGHNVVIGRHCVIVAQTGLSGSTTLGDFVVLGARVGTNNHVTIGDGAQIAALSIITRDVPPGERWGGTPAKPVDQWFKEMRALERLTRGAGRRNKASADDDGGH